MIISTRKRFTVPSHPCDDPFYECNPSSDNNDEEEEDQVDFDCDDEEEEEENSETPVKGETKSPVVHLSGSFEFDFGDTYNGDSVKSCLDGSARQRHDEWRELVAKDRAAAAAVARDLCTIHAVAINDHLDADVDFSRSDLMALWRDSGDFLMFSFDQAMAAITKMEKEMVAPVSSSGVIQAPISCARALVYVMRPMFGRTETDDFISVNGSNAKRSRTTGSLPSSSCSLIPPSSSSSSSSSPSSLIPPSSSASSSSSSSSPSDTVSSDVSSSSREELKAQHPKSFHMISRLSLAELIDLCELDKPLNRIFSVHGSISYEAVVKVMALIVIARHFIGHYALDRMLASVTVACEPVLKW